MSIVAPFLGSVAVPRVLAQGRRVRLRTFTRADMVHFSRWADSEFVEAMVGSDFLYQYKHLYHRRNDLFLDLLVRDGSQLNALIVPVKGDSDPVGFVRLFNINLLHGYAFLETVIADPHSLRRGWGVEASQLIVLYAVDALGIRRIEAKAYAYNRLSQNALRRNGFRLEGALRQACFHDGRYWDILVFGILKDEIEEQRKKIHMKTYAEADDPHAVGGP
jgi:RimJ/RimL family protein N-acetyltransferase